MKTVGIITMHKPVSYGSALQAYALQKKIDDLGYNAQLIDYKYPNKSHVAKNKPFVSYLYKMASFFVNMIFGFPDIQKNKKFEFFYNSYYKLSKFYDSEESLIEDPPKYDIYMTGSDQVWNVKFVKNDTSFLLGFVSEENKKCSYAASFAIKDLPSEYQPYYKTLLSQYDHITVREQSGVKLVNQITGKDAFCVCDPTLLL